MNNQMSSKVWDEIVYVFPNLNDYTTGVDSSFRIARRERLREQFIIRRLIDNCD